MRKIIALLLALLLILAMDIPAFAVTPKLDVPDMPEIPDISGSVKVEIPDSFWDNWFKEHPFKIDFSKFKWGWN